MIPQLTAEEIQRFHSKTERGDGCWLWTCETNNRGYGRFAIRRDNKRIRLLAHRVAYLLATGEEPGTSVVRHACDNPPCCNPAHLRLGTQKDNVHDAIVRRRARQDGLSLGRELQKQGLRERLARGEKLCPACATVKPLDAFHKARSQPDGRQGWCKACRSEQLRTLWRTDPEFRERECARKRRKRAGGGLNEDERSRERRRRTRKVS